MPVYVLIAWYLHINIVFLFSSSGGFLTYLIAMLPFYSRLITLSRA